MNDPPLIASLADLQRAPGSPPPRLPAALPLTVERVRTFDAPEFAGMTFLEVESKTALNRVKGMGFNWSINPYRGCSHACTYCIVGETPILMGNGRTKPLGELRVGDEVYGTIQAGRYRRYVITRVLDHWSTAKPAYRISLRDGTELIASGDHRFLTKRGWKYVTGTEQGRHRRPFLTTNNKLIGTGGFATPPKDTPDYRRGYLCGMIRGDAHIDSYLSKRPGRAPSLSHSFRLALVDREGLQRTAEYLLDLGIPTREFVFAAETATRQQIDAISASSRAKVEAITDFIAWPRDPSDDWCKGFLAGIFDAEGGYNQGVLRISNTDPEILDRIMACLGRFSIPFVKEPPNPNGCVSIRIPGGLRQHLRFFHTTDPAITRKRSIEEVALKSDAPLQVEAIEPLGIDIPMFDITTGTGDFIANGVVSHNCFARPTHSYLNLSPLEDFERTIVVKANVVQVLRRELARPSWRGEHVAMGTNTDPYQRCEGRYKLMPGIIDALASSLTPFSILTKGTLITRDIPALQAAAERVEVSAALTIGMLDEALWRESEPGTPSPKARIGAVKALNEAGIPTGVMLAPIMPGLNDDHGQLAELIDRLAEAGATHISPIVLHLRPGVRELFWPWLERAHPELVNRYTQLYSRSRAAKAYRDEITAFVAERRRAAQSRHGRPMNRPAAPGGPRAGRTAAPVLPAAPDQLRLL
ncbi:MAG TPA: intein-containing Rv2578c family radical SAM protein [Egibacteraceae bacterium]|nr:intein-containing Rv2578c family radical SAM protein [Egibacteraceae bacterium]